MRIAFVYDVPFPWHKGGSEYIISVEARELAKKHEVHYFTMRWPGMGKVFKRENVTYHTYGTLSEETAYRHGRRSVREAMAFSGYMTDLFRYDFDVIISHVFPVLHLPLIKSYCRIKGAMLIIKADEVWDRDYWLSYLGPVLGDVANAYANTFIKSKNAYYVASSKMTAGRLEEFGVSKDRIRFFSPVLDNRTLEKIRKDVKVKKKRVVFSGRFIKEKRIDKWVNVVSKVVEADSGASALLIGSGNEKAGIRRRLEELEMEKRIKIRPFFKNKKALYREIAGSKVMLHMSEREGLGIIALESIALGTPVVLPDYSPIPKEVREMCVVEKESGLPRKISEILNKDGNYIRKAENLKLFSESNVIDFYENLFKSELG